MAVPLSRWLLAFWIAWPTVASDTDSLSDCIARLEQTRTRYRFLPPELVALDRPLASLSQGVAYEADNFKNIQAQAPSPMRSMLASNAASACEEYATSLSRGYAWFLGKAFGVFAVVALLTGYVVLPMLRPSDEKTDFPNPPPSA